MTESTQHILDRVRPPRVQITYDVEIGDAIEMKELPFVMGILADLSGERDPDRPMKKVKDRKFVEIDRDNFNDIMADIAPRVAFRVPNKLGSGKPGEETEIGVLLNFKNMDDFGPIQVIKQIEPLNKLYQARTKLHDLLAKLDGNDALEGMLQNILQNADARSQLQKNLTQADANPGVVTEIVQEELMPGVVAASTPGVIGVPNPSTGKAVKTAPSVQSSPSTGKIVKPASPANPNPNAGSSPKPTPPTKPTTSKK